MNDGAKLALGCLLAIVAAPIGVILLLMVIGRLLGLGETTVSNQARYDNQARDAALVVVQEGGGGAGGWTTTSFRIQHRGLDREIAIHPGWSQVSPVWASEREVLVCDGLLDEAIKSIDIGDASFVLRNDCDAIDVSRTEEP
ncbi:hypothetical protein [Brevundimonas sp.]|uniref:hypothetical protein n=1 Tax=Brevundimonas sp. TaxID=1871086 RepID=UPI003D1241B0